MEQNIIKISYYDKEKEEVVYEFINGDIKRIPWSEFLDTIEDKSKKKDDKYDKG